MLPNPSGFRALSFPPSSALGTNHRIHIRCGSWNNLGWKGKLPGPEISRDIFTQSLVQVSAGMSIPGMSGGATWTGRDAALRHILPQHHPGLGTRGGTNPAPHGFLSPPPLPKPALLGEEGAVLIPGPWGSLWIPWQQPQPPDKRLRTQSCRDSPGRLQQDSPAHGILRNKRPSGNTQELGGSTSSQIFQEYQRAPE